MSILALQRLSMGVILKCAPTVKWQLMRGRHAVGRTVADSSGQHQDEGSTLTKTGAGTLELTASGTTQSAVRVEEGTLKGDVADIFLMLRHCGSVMGQRSLLARIRIFSQLMLLPAALSTSAMVRFCA